MHGLIGNNKSRRLKALQPLCTGDKCSKISSSVEVDVSTSPLLIMMNRFQKLIVLN